jgi:hypothetical protein
VSSQNLMSVPTAGGGALLWGRGSVWPTGFFLGTSGFRGAPSIGTLPWGSPKTLRGSFLGTLFWPGAFLEDSIITMGTGVPQLGGSSSLALHRLYGLLIVIFFVSRQCLVKITSVQLAIVVHAYNPSTWEAEGGGL